MDLPSDHPPLGAMLPNPLGVRSGCPTLVLILGRLDLSTLELLLRLDDSALQVPGLEIVAVLPSSPERASGIEVLTNARLKIVFDPEDKIADKYQVSWAPRAYLLDRYGSLRWCQPSPEYTAPVLLEAVAARIKA